MVQSMTGFGSAEKDGCRIELRSVNHKFLELYVRLPSFLSPMEMPLRTALKNRFSRGKFDLTVTIPEQAAVAVTVNEAFVDGLVAEFRRLQDKLGLAGQIDINTVMAMKDILVETGKTFDTEAVMDVFMLAMADLEAMRLREGAALAEVLISMTEGVKVLNEKVKAMAGAALISARQKFIDKIRFLLEGREPDEDRLLQEAAIMATRLDIAEETARIESHIAQFAEIVSTGGIIGRKLDFILQELNREVNTVASKSADYALSSLTVEMKSEIEKIREQVQNIQ